MSDDSGSFGFLVPEVAATAAPYRVLARKYRPSSFDDLIGQEAMVRTLTNAFALNRVHQAYLLSGVRGVGKTTTARILARALNYHRPAGADGPAFDGPTVLMPGLGTHCQAIIDSRHVDVIEMDAASHTGIDDIRELIDGSRYRPVMARHKVYIIDEVHMLSKAAFNGLLKTLEEPPEHVKFLFATTEADKVPVTVRSRTQRFDLRRIEAPVMIAHLARICAREGIPVEEEALALIARAAEGSVRDALSLLDQAIAHGASAGAGEIAGTTVRLMLGLADRGRVIDLFEAVMRGDIAVALNGLRELYDAGADPLGLMAALADFVHLVTRLKLVPEAAKDPALTVEERTRGVAFAQALGVPLLTRAWQMLSKGIEDVRAAPRALAAADMVLVRLAYAADLPTPDEAIRRLGSLGEPGAGLPVGAGAAMPGLPSAPAGGAALAPPRTGLRQGGVGRAASPSAMPAVAPPPADGRPLPTSLDDVLALAVANRDILLQTAIERDIRPIRFEPGHLAFEAAPGASPQLAGQLTKRLGEWTGTRWIVSIETTGGAPTLRERKAAQADVRRQDVAAHPVVAKILAMFPGSRILDPGAMPAGTEVAEVPLEEDRAPEEVPFDDEVAYPSEETGPDDSDADDL